MANSQESSLVLSPNEFVYVQDSTKGEIKVLVGPHKPSLTGEDFPIVFREDTKKFERVELSKAIQFFAIAPEGWYIILKNPSPECPVSGRTNIVPILNMGRKVNIPGPVSFSLWPGQMKKVVQGHHLRSNQYLLVRVYDEEEAKKNISNAIIKPVDTKQDSSTKLEDTKQNILTKPEEKDTEESSFLATALTMGKLLIIKGTEVAFYIPPTGIEVVATKQREYVREATTLETLEYCILLNENGEKRYIHGPSVVFPEPTETFIESDGKKVFKAYELNEISGLYLKVISEYEEDDKIHEVGEELFITGNEQAIYYPRPEHAIIKYGKEEIHHGTAIPAGEGRYTLDRINGPITLERGPCILLPDPRRKLIVKRILDLNTVALWYPENQEALDYNSLLLSMLQETRGGPSKEGVNYIEQSDFSAKIAMTAPAARGFMPDRLERKTSYTPPRTITLDTKYEGAPIIKVWTGYAVLITSKTGKRKVVTGPAPVLLEYDETLEYMELSTGTPKTDAKLFKTVYLRVQNNKVSDIVQAETKDLCPIEVQLSYRVNFEDIDKSFNVENYVKFLTDHLRSLIGNIVKQYGIAEFYTNYISIIRDCVLGKSDGEKRPGRSFDENGMKVYECEVLNIKITNIEVQKMLKDAQSSSIQNTITLAKNRSNLEFTKENEDIQRQISNEQHKTFLDKSKLTIEEIQKNKEGELEKVKSSHAEAIEKLNNDLARSKISTEISEEELSKERSKSNNDLEVKRDNQITDLEKLKAETEAEVQRITSVSTDLIAALQAFGDQMTLEKVTESLAPMVLLGGGSVAEIINKLLRGTSLENVLSSKKSK